MMWFWKCVSGFTCLGFNHTHLLPVVHIMDYLVFFLVLLFHPAAVSEQQCIFIKLKTPGFLSPPIILLPQQQPVAANTWNPNILLYCLNRWEHDSSSVYAVTNIVFFCINLKIAVWFVCFVTTAKVYFTNLWWIRTRSNLNKSLTRPEFKKLTETGDTNVFFFFKMSACVYWVKQ